MNTTPAGRTEHAALMDRAYRGQRHIYDATRRFFLFGRDTMIAELHCAPGESVLEIACGTGRNLAKIARRWPGTELYGLDISREMLKSAHARLGSRAVLGEGDATRFEPGPLFGRDRFDRVVISFALSMIPDWQIAIDRAAGVLAPGGSLHIVDFGSLDGLPGPVAGALTGWLAHFHVTPRKGLADSAARRATNDGMIWSGRAGPFGYYQLITVNRDGRKVL